MKITFKYYWLTILWALFILIICDIKMGAVSKSPMFFAGFDKLVHCGLYFVLVTFWSTGYVKKHGVNKLTYSVGSIITITAIVYGGIIELLQLYIFTWRSGEWDDLFADALGACMAAFGVLLTIKAIDYVKK